MNLGSPKALFAPEMARWPKCGNRTISFELGIVYSVSPGLQDIAQVAIGAEQGDLWLVPSIAP
jgi:hypothetical protein